MKHAESIRSNVNGVRATTPGDPSLIRDVRRSAAREALYELWGGGASTPWEMAARRARATRRLRAGYAQG